MKSKFLLYVLIALAIIAIAAFFIYQLVYRVNNTLTAPAGQTGSLPTVTNQQFPSGGQPAVANFNTSAAASSSKFGVVSTDPALDYFVNAANTVSLMRPDGVIESVVNNQITVLSSSTISNIINASFSYDGKKVFVIYQAGTTTRTSVFDLATQAWFHLPDGIRSPVWSPTNHQMAYLLTSNSGLETLSTINIDATSSKPVVITSLSMENSALQWPNKNTIIISDRPSVYTTDSVWSLDIPSQKLTSVAYEKLGLESLWNASSAALIFSAESNNAGGRLMFRDSTGAQKALDFLTLPSKCGFGPSVVASGTANSSVFVYCAVPQDQNTLSSVRLPDEYDQEIYFTNDDFYRIDTVAGSLVKIFSFSTANQNIDATDMKVINNILFFINRYDQKIYALALSS